LVTKKNRKVRRLRELYPDVKCKVFYERDYLNLLVKYGLEEPDQKTLVRPPRSRQRQRPIEIAGPSPVPDASPEAGSGDS
jgi:hypothetical protein